MFYGKKSFTETTVTLGLHIPIMMTFVDVKLSQHLSLTDRKHTIQNNAPKFIDEKRMAQKELIYLSHSENKSNLTFLRAHSVLRH